VRARALDARGHYDPFGCATFEPITARLNISLHFLLATHNEHKRREFARLLEGPSGGWEIDALPDTVVLPPEDGETFAENALGKARAAAQATGRVSIADDSGIAAAALKGAPGVRSARYAGEHATDEQNLEKLLREVPTGSPLEYICVIAYVDPGSGVERVFEGRCSGRLAERPTGEGGFGYDPAFLADDGPAGVTMAQLSDEQKDAISHRGHAARALQAWLSAG
jgi:XTP/dITP diphosphohydrolase